MTETIVGSEEGKEERAVPGLTDLGNVCKHIARYNLALMYADKKDVLDAACGSGYGSFLLSLVAQSVLGADCSELAVAYAKQNFSTARVKYSTGDVAALSCSVDLVVSFETIEHLENLELFGQAVLRYLRPGGKIIYSVPLNESPGFNPYHRHIFTYETARRIFPMLTLKEELIQHGINFYGVKQVPLNQPWLAYIGVAQKA